MSSDSNNLVLKRIGTYDLTGNRLGEGNFAYVELATNRITKSKVAMKVIDTRKIKDDYVKRNILREALLLKKVNHPNIVRLYETLKQHSIYCIVTEYVSGGELLTYLRSQPESKLSESQARPIMRQLISALYHMHENGIVHRDLKMENILLDESKKNIKIVDFGLSNICEGDKLLKTQCGSPEYAAPELFRRGCQYGTEVDLWSLGVVMYGIVIGRLPFRSPHFGSRGRSELLDQTSRGLSCTHNKYLVHLTPHCRDLLRKLLEPNPQMRAPLLDVMEHPWITAHGTMPLAPNTEQLMDEQLRDKALSRASQLINIDKPKIARHIRQNRYDAVSGVYNLLLDEERKKVLSSNDCAGGVMRTSDQGNSVIRVFINSTTCDGKEDGSQCHESKSSTGSDSENSQTEPDWDQARTQKHVVHKPEENKSVEEHFEDLWIRGHKVCCTQSTLTRKQSHKKTRSNTALEGQHAPRETPSFCRQRNKSTRALQRTRKTRCKSCVPRITIDSKMKGTQMVMSPRIKLETKLLVSQSPQQETNIQTPTSEKFANSESLSEESVKPGVSGSERNCVQSKMDAGDIQNENADVNLEHKAVMKTTIRTECGLKVTSGDTQSTKSTAARGENASQMLQLNQKFSSARNSIRSPKSGSKISPSSLAHCSNRTVSSLRTSQFVDLADYYKHVPQPPKSRGAPQQGASRIPTNEEEREGRCDSISALCQSYMKNKKTPQHPRLSIMQAREILRLESKFHTKYGRRLGTEDSNSNPDSSKQPENQVPHHRDESIVTHDQKNETQTKTNFQLGMQNYFKGISSLREQGEITACVNNREENLREKKNVSSYERQAGPDLSREPYFHDNRPDNINMDEVRVGTDDHSATNQDSREVESKLRPQQEECIKRQKEKELLEYQERERTRFLQEIKDQERRQIITEYLQNVYTRSTAQPHSVRGQSGTRTNNVTRQGRAHSVLTRSSDRQSSDVPQVITKPVPILQQATRDSQADKRTVSFRGPNESKATNAVRFFNEWSNSVFTEYINSSDSSADKGTEQHKFKMNDPSRWIEQHLNGVLDEATLRRDYCHYQQSIFRET